MNQMKIVGGATWTCKKCGFKKNFDNKKACHSCKTPKLQAEHIEQKLPHSVHGWLETKPNYGDLIPNTPLIPMKAPLSTSEFTVEKFIKEQKKKFKREISLIVDLSHSKHYYNPEDFPEGVKHLSLSLESKVS